MPGPYSSSSLLGGFDNNAQISADEDMGAVEEGRVPSSTTNGNGTATTGQPPTSRGSVNVSGAGVNGAEDSIWKQSASVLLTASTRPAQSDTMTVTHWPSSSCTSSEAQPSRRTSSAASSAAHTSFRSVLGLVFAQRQSGSIAGTLRPFSS